MVATNELYRSKEGEPTGGSTDSSNKFLSEQRTTTGSGTKSWSANDSAALVNKNTLPGLELTGSTQSSDSHAHESGFMHFMHNVGTVASDVAKGAWHEITEHPLQVAESAVIGLGVGAVTAVAAPEVLAAMAVGGAAYGAYELVKNAGHWMHSADVVTHQDKYSAASIAAAHSDLQGFGAGATLIAAGTAGGMIGRPLAGMISESLAGTSSATTLSSEEGTVMHTLMKSVQSGAYEPRDIGGVTVLMPRQQTVMDVLANAVRDGKYTVGNVNGVAYFKPTGK